MTLPAAVSILALIAYLGVLALVFSRLAPAGALLKDRPTQFFVGYLCNMLAFQGVYLMVSLSDHAPEALFWYAFTIPLFLGQVLLYLLFTRAFLGFKPLPRLALAAMLFLPVIATLAAFLSPDLVFSHVYYQAVTDLYVPEIGPLASALLTPLLLFWGVILSDLIRGYRIAQSSLQRARIQYLFLAVVIVWLGMVANASPVLRPYPLDVGANLVSALLIAQAILRYQLFDIRSAFRKSLVYLVSVLLMGVGYFFIIFFVVEVLPLGEAAHSSVLYLMLSVLIAAMIIPLRDQVQSRVHYTLFREQQDGLAMLQRLSHVLRATLDLNTLAAAVLDEMTTTLRARWAVFFVERDGEFYPFAQTGSLPPPGAPSPAPPICFAQDHPLLRWLSEHDPPASMEVCRQLSDQNLLTQAQCDELARAGFALFVPIKAHASSTPGRRALIGILALGDKLAPRKEGRARRPPRWPAPVYTSDEEMVLTALAGQVASAMHNAQLYEIVRQELNERKHIEKEREALIVELERKNAELEQFAYTVSHDLKAPLITIRGFLGFIEKDIRDGDAARAHSDIARVAQAAEKMQRLLNELLELSRVGRVANPSENIPFEQIVREALEAVRGRVEAAGVRVELAPGLPVIYGDRLRLVESVQNLLDNACKFTGGQPDPCIWIGQQGCAADGKPILYVRDNGIGIAAEYHDKVFGLFNKLSPQSEGTGVGLSLVKRIIETHGGKIWIESQAGGGATFYFTLPAQV